jgi:calmodulin-lysine N-methyltransferase
MRTLLAGRVRGRCAGRRVLELGGGMTGLCGLGLAARGGCAAVTVTDGHPDCVRNTAVGLTMSRQAGVIPPRCAVRAARLRWSVNDALGDFRRLLDGGGAGGAGRGGFDVVVAADCLFFEDFHDALLWTLEAALTSNGRDGVGAAAYLLQVRDSDCG